jgi:hypothetical protein
MMAADLRRHLVADGKCANLWGSKKDGELRICGGQRRALI